ncbi:hypothetical protein C499_18859 [Halogeometricum borinquense DSM 11551]|uniref:Uncharacterized protein n=2 Tax=Halogeometricum borinquense TaxID=60847 RepID=E4NND9_HALBP|nr:hypothetical protein [Halogeometricum borinquense]ADQ67477.1 hypothetical protein Hbor_19100 [Halogeometricum borinquense DSM 11551]ELY23841.1 hypothetical protein C499_18859 [Halogeometricum borinquense DSM 11551]RYJ13548.1 hypothetical protein ELS19_05955 [Halogeometricum borinquense]
MRTKLAVGVGIVVALAGVASTMTTGGELSEAIMWVVFAMVPAAIVALGGIPSGYSHDRD